MINQFYIKINFDLNLLKQFLSYIDENTSIKWAGGEPTMYFSSRKIDAIFISNNTMQYASDLNHLFINVPFYRNFKEITIENLSILNPKDLFYD